MAEKQTREAEQFDAKLIKKLDNYVYRLIDPRNGETFYVGKGTGNRVFAHVNAASDLLDYAEDDDDKARLSEKLHTIRDIKLTGLEVIHIIHRHGMNKNQALEVEAALIDIYPGLTNVVRGKGADRGPDNAEALMWRHNAEEMTIDESLKILAIKIGRSYSHRDNIYEAVRRAWKLKPENARDAKYVFALVGNVCYGVFKAHEWKQDYEHSDRWQFFGKVAEEKIQEQYVGKKLPVAETPKRGAANPVIYIPKKAWKEGG